MGGQACVLYGAAEFSRDADFAVLASSDNLRRLREALDDLHAEVIAVPPFEEEFLRRGHAVHFRCHHPDAHGVRVDVMSRIRGLEGFEVVWQRRTTWPLPGGLEVQSLSLPDLVTSKKTQRDKDWPMVRRLVEVSYAEGWNDPTPERIDFWLGELRTPEILMEVVARFHEEAAAAAPVRTAVQAALDGNLEAVSSALKEEEAQARQADREYWAPLRAELERLRRGRKAEP